MEPPKIRDKKIGIIRWYDEVFHEVGYFCELLIMALGACLMIEVALLCFALPHLVAELISLVRGP